MSGHGRAGDQVLRRPSAKVMRSALRITALLTLLSLSISSGFRFLAGIEYDLTLFMIRAGTTTAIVLPLAVVTYSRIERWESDYAALMRETQMLAREAGTDPLTGLLNRRSFEKQFDLAMSFRKGGYFLIADIDYLKTINDRHGHLAGDEAIIAAAGALREVLGTECLIARIGGDEFCAFVPDSAALSASQLSERMNAVATKEFQKTSGLSDVPVQISIGLRFCGAGASFRTMLQHSDRDLYRKKKKRLAAMPSDAREGKRPGKAAA